MRQVNDGVIYDTDKATLLASDEPDVTEGMERLYRSAAGRYFLEIIPGFGLSRTVSTIKPLSVQEAIKAFNTLPIRKSDYLEAFPDVEFIDA